MTHAQREASSFLPGISWGEMAECEKAVKRRGEKGDLKPGIRDIKAMQERLHMPI